ncbi:MAG: hypothetical protein HXS46_13880 [Theionarchaea archaeon]|nr:MAG: hypothetical protein AYK18_01355 [Theionarchaea archaeon DG-70]MBU7011773.1 hypothetical protein [Theionarchaea archaeon]
MEHKITFSDETEKDIRMIVDEFGFNSEEEFVEEAVVEKILQLKKQIFFNITDQVGAALRSKGITVKQMLEEFEEVRE